MSRTLYREYSAVCSLIHRSGLQNLNHLPYYLNKRDFHSTPQNLQQPPGGKPGDDKNKPNNNNNKDDDDDKISSLLAKAFLWMLTAYMVIAIISLMFPSSSQPEVIIMLTPELLIFLDL